MLRETRLLSSIMCSNYRKRCLRFMAHLAFLWQDEEDNSSNQLKAPNVIIIVFIVRSCP